MKHLIAKSLCTRCGACFAEDRNHILTKDTDGFPLVVDGTAAEANRLRSLCSGHAFPFQDALKNVHGQQARYDPSASDPGIFKSIHIAYSTNREAVKQGQSGGVSTTLIKAGMELGLLDAFLGVRRPDHHTGNPFAAEPVIIDKPEMAHLCAGSKYSICASLEVLPDLAKHGRAFGMSLLPCQTAAFHKLTLTGKKALREQCKLIIGPFCGLNMNHNAGSELAQAMGITPNDVARFANRGGTFPGTTTFEMKDGRQYYLDRTAHRALYRMFAPDRCFTCIDYGNELADISVADVWLQHKGAFQYPQGAAWVIARTQRGADFLEQVCRAGYLTCHPIPPEKPTELWRQSFIHRKVRAFNRLHQQKNAGIEIPEYEIPLPDYNRKYKRADDVELRCRRIFRHRLPRRLFLAWWVRAAKGLGVGPAYRFELRYFDLLRNNVFTHREHVVSMKRAFLYLLAYAADDIRLDCWLCLPRSVRHTIQTICNRSRRPGQKAPKKPTFLHRPIKVRVGKPDKHLILIAGGYGYGNTGDEAQLGANISRWRKSMPEAQLLALSPNPGYTSGHHAIRSAPASRTLLFASDKRSDYSQSSHRFQRDFWRTRKRLLLAAWCIRHNIPTCTVTKAEAMFLELLASASILHLSGGGYLTGMTRSRLWEHMLLLRLAHVLGVPSILTGHTIGVFQNNQDRKLARWGLRCPERITVRDRNESTKALREIGITGDHIEERFDDALFCDQATHATLIPYLVAAGLDPRKPYVAVNTHNWGQDTATQKRLTARLAELCDYIQTQHNLQILFCPMVASDENSIQQTIASMQQAAGMLAYDYDYRIVRAAIGASHFCLTLKHHPIVFAMGNCVPCIAITMDEYYRHKNAGALALFGMREFLLHDKDLFTNKAEGVIETLMTNNERIRNTVNSKLAVYQKINADMQNTSKGLYHEYKFVD